MVPISRSSATTATRQTDGASKRLAAAASVRAGLAVSAGCVITSATVLPADRRNSRAS